jgi:hypothetical protein
MVVKDKAESAEMALKTRIAKIQSGDVDYNIDYRNNMTIISFNDITKPLIAEDIEYISEGGDDNISYTVQLTKSSFVSIIVLGKEKKILQDFIKRVLNEQSHDKELVIER